jgi:hypothetical protein
MRMNFQEVLLLFLCHQINNVKTILIVCSVLLSISVVGNCAGAPVLLKLELLKTASSTAPSSAQVSNLEQILLRISWNPKDLTQDETSAIRSGSGLKLTARDTNSGGTKPVSFTIIGSGHEPTTGFIELYLWRIERKKNLLPRSSLRWSVKCWRAKLPMPASVIMLKIAQLCANLSKAILCKMLLESFRFPEGWSLESR